MRRSSSRFGVANHQLDDAEADVQVLCRQLVPQHIRPLHKANGLLHRLFPADALQVQRSVQAVQIKMVYWGTYIKAEMPDPYI